MKIHKKTNHRIIVCFLWISSVVILVLLLELLYTCLTIFSACLIPYSTNLYNFNFDQLEVIFRYRNPQPHVDKNYSYLFNLGQKIDKSYMYEQSFI